MPRTDVTITTHDGACPASVFTPSGSSGPWPAVIFYMDGFGIRPVMWSMGARLADAGYLVLLPDLYYRSGVYEPMEPKALLAQPDGREILMRYVGSLDRDKKVADTEAFLAYLATLSLIHISCHCFRCIRYAHSGSNRFSNFCNCGRGIRP